MAKKLSGIFLEIVFNMIATKNPNLDWLESLSMEEENLGISKEVYFDRKGVGVSGNLVEDFYVSNLVMIFLQFNLMFFSLRAFLL